MIEILPALAVRKEALIPNNEIRIEVGREISLNALNLSESRYDSRIVLLIQKDPIVENVSPEDVLPVGVYAKMVLKVKLPSGNYKVKFKLLQRVEIEEFVTEDECFTVKFNPLHTIYGDPNEERTLLKMIVQEVLPKAKEYLNNADEVLRLLQSGSSSELACDLLAFNFP